MSFIERESMPYDVVIVGAGPAGLSAAIRIKQLEPDFDVVVLEKGSEVGAHILSGAVLDPSGLTSLIPDWKKRGAPITVAVKEDHFLNLTETGSQKIPNYLMPPLMNNHGNYIVSMGNVCRWMAEQAEGMGVEIFPGMACSELVYGENGEVKGVVAGEFGKNSDGTNGANYEPGMELHGKYIFLSEGVRGSLSKEVIGKYRLDANSDVPKFGLGMKEIWEVKPENHNEGEVLHTMGWPMTEDSGGSFMYHLDNNQVYVGFIVDLNYKNPHLFPYMEFQRWKHHPKIAKVLQGGKRVSYGARAVTKGGFQSIPKVVFPGGAILGCSAGLVNLPRIKGNHNAMHSGRQAAEAAVAAIKLGRSGDELIEYNQDLKVGPIGQDLKKVRNVAPLRAKYGPILGVALGGFDMWCQTLLKFSVFGTVKHGKTDAESTGKATDYALIEYPKPDGKLSFDRLTNVSFSGTNHAEDQPSHLCLTDPTIPIRVNLSDYAEPAQRYCPAGVYEIIRNDDGSNPKFHVNSQNCVHCKTCDIKDPSQNITWVTPQGGDGPNYPNM
ncbi:MAG: electron transfer flavoprotein-ubiquinone oxidoreductase [Amylibacter sp.]|jgi:electron-transferring-flavoprotein dehydrogenase|tara:strand:- start:23238 stop:24890 length:1653 start_codon:yes stop_codon:yes gene_type:complete